MLSPFRHQIYVDVPSNLYNKKQYKTIIKIRFCWDGFGVTQCEILLDLARSQLCIVGEEGDINTQTASCFSLLGFSITAVPAEHTPRHNRPAQTFIKDYQTSLLHSSIQSVTEQAQRQRQRECFQGFKMTSCESCENVSRNRKSCEYFSFFF